VRERATERVKFCLKKSQVHNNCIKSGHLVKKTFSAEQTIILIQTTNKCSTKSGKTLHIALCIVIKYIHEKQDNKNQKDQLLGYIA